MEELERSAAIIIRDCMAIRPEETVLVITDGLLRKIGYLLWEVAKGVASEAMIIEIVPRLTSGEEPPRAVAELMKHVDAILAPTSKSLTHTRARREACAHGTRVATLPGITEETMERMELADYRRITDRSTKIAQVLTRGATARVITPAGTDVSMSLVGMRAYADTGLIHNSGQYGNLPAGEAFLAPIEGSANGVIVVDGSMAGTGRLATPIKLTVVNGFVTEVAGGKEAEDLTKAIEPFGQPARNVAELGIGTNDRAVLTGNILEDEKVIGTVHMAIGDNASMGGRVSVPSHLDGILLNPTVEVDEEVIMKDGNLMI